jgi:hypothetical protein
MLPRAVPTVCGMKWVLWSDEYLPGLFKAENIFFILSGQRHLHFFRLLAKLTVRV